ncbi:MAG: T9SS type A sorting domain-containing protein [Gracilimonas sp.]|uniref:T9SS type A sorting domain-containing protein n=1 Tax=Gracilimonas sp. TaxID=1974203 RepID=UPI003750BC62|nr:T9SS type A sorting domain-containing protein [Gracilimonas sp.]
MNKLQGPDPLHDYLARMKYFGNGFSSTTVNDWQKWNVSDHSNDNLDLYMYLMPVEFTQPINYVSENIHVEEHYDDSVQISMKGLDNKYYGNYINYRFNAVGILRADQDGITFNEPNVHFNWNNSGQQREQQLFVLKNSNTEIDVIWRRSYSTSASILEEISYGGEFISSLRLSSNSIFGFIRLQKQNGVWESQADYELNLEQVYPIQAAISGPTGLSVAQYGTWTVAASSPPGAPGSFSYEWFLKSDDPAANGEWIGPLDYDESYTTRMYHFDNYLKLRVDVRRDKEFAAVNHYVFCNDCGSGGGGGMLSAQSSENDPSRQVKPHRTFRADTAVVLKRTGKVGTGSMQTTNPHFSLPEEFSLEQNYPNPFNPTTKLTFALPEESEVQVTIYNIMGQQVATLVQENLTAGFHEATFDAKNLSSGMYLARIRAIGNSGQVFTKELKMQLIK